MQFLNCIFELWFRYHKGLPVNDLHLDIVTVLSANVGHDGFEGCAEKISALLASIVKDVGSECRHLPFFFALSFFPWSTRTYVVARPVVAPPSSGLASTIALSTHGECCSCIAVNTSRDNSLSDESNTALL